MAEALGVREGFWKSFGLHLAGHRTEFSDELSGRGCAVGAAVGHAVLYCADGLGGDSRAVEHAGDVLRSDVLGVRRRLSREHEQQGGGQGVDIALRRELAQAGILFERRIALGAAYGVDGRGGHARGVVMLGQTEVDEHRAHTRVAVGAQHYVGGLDVEVGYAVGMEVFGGMQYGLHDGERLSFVEGAVLSDIGGEGRAFEILHHIVGGAVGLEDFAHLHDVPVGRGGGNFAQTPGLGNEILEGGFDSLAVVGMTIDHAVGLSEAQLFGKVLLDGEMGLYRDAVDRKRGGRQIGDAETTRAEHPLDAVAVGGASEQSARGKSLRKVGV